jgi:hypothetical protein
MNHLNEQIIECINMPIAGVMEYELCQFGRGILLEFVNIKERLVRFM